MNLPIVRLRDVPRWFLNAIIAVLVLLLVAVLLARTAVSAPRVSSVEECEVAINAMLYARAMAVNGVELEKARAVIAATFVAHTENGAKVFKAIVDAAYRSDLSPIDLAGRLGTMCVHRRGNMDELLGVDS
jgi:hypothetical protein